MFLKKGACCVATMVAVLLIDFVWKTITCDRSIDLFRLFAYRILFFET